jgi:SH3 domain-containing YSC84-like protein 1
MRVAVLTVLLCMGLCMGVMAWAENMSELEEATATVKRMNTAGDQGIPDKVLEGAKCVAVIPKLTKGAFVVGGEHGTGVATCRAEGMWSAPAPFELSGISWGAQIGGKTTDLVMFIMNEQGMKDLMQGHLKVGADVSAAAGPVGRSASADAGYKAGILTYSSSKGAFIGASINGAEIRQDHKKTKDWYDNDSSFEEILSGKVKTSNQQAKAFVDALANAKTTASQ